ncbi:hypothetical protein DTW90_27765 [Neorhizobium sp. P12A]|uniref:hypothetical protein n=1 Tax=Neorhizobium sp. P12A TaxID=2268027 RepID=UPI0011EC8F04|nr:hypothetical protein [Neorhizobium sp. P12A]KAA0692004.1 hypothetical protein DTW90_27765 [Neorhizobium sp. P12A]
MVLIGIEPTTYGSQACQTAGAPEILESYLTAPIRNEHLNVESDVLAAPGATSCKLFEAFVDMIRDPWPCVSSG